MGRAGGMLANCWNDLRIGGVVLGLCDVQLDTQEMRGVVCQWCASDCERVLGLEMEAVTTFPGSTRHLHTTICVPACSSCSDNLIKSLLKAKKQRSGR
jgi:hypothetical protein